MKRGDLVFVRWEDSVGSPQGWVRLDEYRGVSVSEVESVGWVAAVGRRGVQLAPHVVVKNAGGVMGLLTIPRSAILAVQVIETASLPRSSSRAPCVALGPSQKRR